MPSYYILPIPETKFDDVQLKEIIAQNTIAKFPRSPKIGIVAKNVVITKDWKYFEYGLEEERTWEDFNGKIISIFPIRKIPIIFLRSNVIAVGRCKSSEEFDQIVNFIGNTFVKGFQIKLMEFNPKILQKTLTQEVLEISFMPTENRDKSIDEIQARGKTDILDSQFYEDHGDKPLISTKFLIKDIKEEVTIQFHKGGSIKLPNNVGLTVNLKILKHIADKIIAPELIQKKFGKNLDGF